MDLKGAISELDVKVEALVLQVQELKKENTKLNVELSSLRETIKVGNLDILTEEKNELKTKINNCIDVVEDCLQLLNNN